MTAADVSERNLGPGDQGIETGAGANRLRLLPVGGVAATTDNVASGEFPMSRPLNLVTRNSADGLALAP